MQNGLFGFPPADLATAAADSIQFSPLVPGSTALEEAPPLASFLMMAPPGTIERRYVMALALRALAPGGIFTVLAPKDKGGSRLAGELEEFGGEVKEDAKRHHRICQLIRPEKLMVENAIVEGQARFSEKTGFWTQPGIFSWDRIDAGSALLQQHLPALEGRGADLGCGYGFLSRAILEKGKISHLTLVDIDRRAVDAARKNIKEKNASFHWADLRTANLDLKNLDFVVTNPPFHDGRMEDQSLGQEFLKRAAAMLKTGGQAWIVANRHLPYEAILKNLFREVISVAEGGGFKIFRAAK